MASNLTRRVLLSYGILGLPLAFAGLPVYVHVPKFYADTTGMDLGVLGTLLLVIRLFDAVVDPLIGLASDRWRPYSFMIMGVSVPVLIAGYIGLFHPPASVPAAVWLTGCLAVVYLSFSTLMINYYSAGVGMAEGYHDHTRIAAFREGSMLIGVLLASVLPTILLQHFDLRSAYGIFSFLLAPLLLVCAAIYFSAVPRSLKHAETFAFSSFFRLLASANVRWVFIVAFCNAVPTAITSTLFLFFTTDILHAGNESGPLLAAYFLSAAFGMPLWTRLSFKFGKKRSLLIAMATAVICFIWAWQLGEGDIGPFLIICILSGMTLGADSMLLPSMLGDALMDKPEATATGFGLWNLTNKLTMATAAGIALPLLAAGGYHSAVANSAEALARLSFCYALLPCLLKMVAIVLLYLSPLDERKHL